MSFFKSSYVVPYEIKNRDYKSRLILSLKLVDQGKDIIFGRKYEIEHYSTLIKNSIYVALSSYHTLFNFYKSLKKNNNKIVILDEENLITLNNQHYYKQRMSKKLMEISDLLFISDEEKLLNIPNDLKRFQKKIKFTGNIRFQILNRKYKNILKKVFKKNKNLKNYILICTSFGNFNHFDKKYSYKNKKLINPARYSFFRKSYYQYCKKMFFINYKLIKFLSQRFPKIIFVIRPHPSENVEPYKKLESQYSNVKVYQNFSVGDWLENARANIHYYCTTSVEAAMIGVPNLTFDNIGKGYFEKFAFENSFRLRNFNSFQKKISQILQKKKTKISKRTLKLKKLDSLKLISDALISLNCQNNKHSSIIEIFIFIKLKVKLFFNSVLNPDYKYVKHKSKSISISKLLEDKEKICKVFKLNNSKIKINKVAKNIFNIKGIE